MGYTSDLFWESSLKDIIDLIQSYRRRAEREREEKLDDFKVKVIMNKVLAEQITELIAISMSDDKNLTPTPLSHYFPELFNDAECNAENKKEKELNIHKARMENFAYWHNKRRREGK